MELVGHSSHIEGVAVNELMFELPTVSVFVSGHYIHLISYPLSRESRNRPALGMHPNPRETLV